MRRFLFIFIAAATLLVFFHRLSESPLGGDDCYYSEVSKEMARTGDYLSPRTGYSVNFHTGKPPVLFWMNALSGKIFGFNTFAMRLPSAIMGFLGVIALLFFVDRYFGAYAAFFSAAVLAFTQQYLYHARSAVTDGPFAVFFALAMMSFWVARSEKRYVFFYISGLFTGLAVMTRSVPGLFIPVTIIAFILASREFGIFRNIHFYGGLLLSAAVFMPWHLWMYHLHGRIFLDQHFGVALMTGIKGYPLTYGGNPSLNPWYAYFSILLSNYWPWLPFMLAGLYKIIGGYARFEPEKRKKLLFILCWLCVPLLIFQAAKVKQYHYIMPLYAPLAVITAMFFDSLKDKAKAKAANIFVYVLAAYTAACLVFPIIPKTLDSREFIDTITFIPDIKAHGSEVTTVNKGGMHYYNCFWFYGDIRTGFETEEGIAGKLRDGDKNYFVLFRPEFDNFRHKVARLRIIKETKDSVLFTGA
jgi:4-amino-4-deoxy-L-arabinose transferase-like glycosyltransferase